MTVSGNSPELDALLLDGIENLDSLSDARLREYAVFALAGVGATEDCTVADLAVLAGVEAARVRERHSRHSVELGLKNLGTLFIDSADNLERELRARALPN